MNELKDRLLAHAKLHAELDDPEQQQWAADLSDAANEIARLRGEAGVLRALLALSRRSLVEIEAEDYSESEMLASLVSKIDAALKGAP